MNERSFVGCGEGIFTHGKMTTKSLSGTEGCNQALDSISLGKEANKKSPPKVVC